MIVCECVCVCAQMIFDHAHFTSMITYIISTLVLCDRSVNSGNNYYVLSLYDFPSDCTQDMSLLINLLHCQNNL